MKSKLRIPFLIALIGVMLLIFLGGCEEKTQKPYIITDKWFLPSGYNRTCGYNYNQVVSFEDLCSKYNIGDTLK